MEMFLKSKDIWKYRKDVILDPSDALAKFVFDRKKDEVVGVIATYISCKIWFHTSGIDFPLQFWKKLKSLFDKVNEI